MSALAWRWGRERERPASWELTDAPAWTADEALLEELFDEAVGTETVATFDPLGRVRTTAVRNGSDGVLRQHGGEDWEER